MYHLSPIMHFFYIRSEPASEYKIKLGFAPEQYEGKNRCFFMIISGFIRKMYFELKHFFIRTKDKVPHSTE